MALFVVRWFQRRSYMKVEERVRARLLLIEVQPHTNFVVPQPMQTVVTF